MSDICNIINLNNTSQNACAEKEKGGCIVYYTFACLFVCCCMRVTRKFCFVRLGPTLTFFAVVVLDDKRREDPNTTRRRPSLAHQRNAICEGVSKIPAWKGVHFSLETLWILGH